jgi:hypothetical protein
MHQLLPPPSPRAASVTNLERPRHINCNVNFEKPARDTTALTTSLTHIAFLLII